jgi:hypothetical protein
MSNEIISDIRDHIRKFGGDFSTWRVGTTSDWHNPVLDSHKSKEEDYALICREAYTPASARAVRDYFVAQCGAAPGNGESNQDGKLVYAYKKAPSQAH